MLNDYVTVGQVEAPVYVTGERFPTRNNVGDALEDVESSGLVALTGPTGAMARIVAPLNDKVWDWFHALTGIYNVTDHEGRFGKKGAKVNVVAHGFGHPLSSSQRVKEALGTEYTRKTGTAQLSEGEEVELLSEQGTPVFAYDHFLEVSQDLQFLKSNPSFRVVRTQDVLGRTKYGGQLLVDLYDNSSVLCYFGGRSPVKVTSPEGEEKTITIAQALVDKTGQRFNRTDLGAGLHDSEGGRVLVFGGSSCSSSLDGSDDLSGDARFVGVHKNYVFGTQNPEDFDVSAGGAKSLARSGNAPEKKVIVPSLEQVLAVLESRKRSISEDAREQLKKDYQALFQ